LPASCPPARGPRVPYPALFRSNPALAQVFRRIAAAGPEAFYQGKVARHIVDAVAGHLVPGDLNQQDLAAYRSIEREPLCAPYKVDRKSTRLNSSHVKISYAVCC